MPSEHGRQTHAAYHTNARTGKLHRRHQGQREERGPESRKAERSSGNSVGANARRIIVRCTGDQSSTTISNGGEITPLITAVQKSADIGLMPAKFIRVPIMVESKMTA